jgi:hypothetical protein
MKRLLNSAILLLWCCTSLAGQSNASVSYDLRGRIVLYDWFSHEQTSNDEFVVKTTDPKLPYVRLIYRAYWGFDAPSSSAKDVLDRWAFIGHGALWAFSAQSPETSGEKGACVFSVTGFKYEDETGNGEVPRFIPTPGADVAGIPPITTLPCFILKRGGLARVDLPKPQ